MAKNTSLLDFNTLYDFDYADYLFQEQTNKKEFKDYKARDYLILKSQCPNVAPSRARGLKVFIILDCFTRY